MDEFEIKIEYCQTPVFDTPQEAWQYLADYIKPLVEDHWVYFRTYPQVDSQYLFDHKKTVYQGFTRFIIDPKPLGLHSDELKIPSLGSA